MPRQDACFKDRCCAVYLSSTERRVKIANPMFGNFHRTYVSVLPRRETVNKATTRYCCDVISSYLLSPETRLAETRTPVKYLESGRGEFGHGRDFVPIGFEHSVANIFLLLAGMLVQPGAVRVSTETKLGACETGQHSGWGILGGR